MIVESEVKVFNTKLGILDFDFAIVFGDLTRSDLTLVLKWSGAKDRVAYLFVELARYRLPVSLPIFLASKSRSTVSSGTISLPCCSLSSTRSGGNDISLSSQFSRSRSISDEIDHLHCIQHRVGYWLWRIEEWRRDRGVIGRREV